MTDRSDRSDGSDVRSEGAVLRAYGLFDLTRAEQRARVGVLDRMGAFAPSERERADRRWFARQACFRHNRPYVMTLTDSR